MSTKHFDTQEILKHPNADSAALWILRILVDLNAWQQLSKFSGCYSEDNVVYKAINLTHLLNAEADEKTFLDALNHQYQLLSQNVRVTGSTFNMNLRRFNKSLGLSDSETKILEFAATLQTHMGLNHAAELLNKLHAGNLFCVISIILDLPEHQVRKALTNEGVLARSGLLRVNRRHTEKLPYFLNLMDGICPVLFLPQTDDILRHYFQKGKKPQLEPDNYAHMQSDYQLIRDYLQQGRQRELAGMNVLLYGLPGTGKTELARTVSEELGMPLFEISTTDEDGEAIKDSKRFVAYQLSQQALARHSNALILFDEIEDVFPCSDDFFASPPSDGPGKAWINQLLEQNPVPAIWVSNDIDQIEKAYIRRFDLVVKLDLPPHAVRETMLNDYLVDMPVSRQWIKQVARNPHLAPALISRAARVVSIMNDGTKCQQQLEQVLSHTLNAMGHSCPVLPSENNQTPISYRLDALNPDRDIKRLIDGLKKHGRGRLCIYGPPGTGKTAFGRHIAEQLEKNLIIKRASDILDAFIGGTEKNLAEMFRQARHDDCILMLDEADSFLQDRSHARYSWEISQVNEFLTQMEDFEGLFICSTNLVDSLDAASLRRFDLKIKFDYLRPNQAWALFQQTLLDQQQSIENAPDWQAKLAKLDCLTPGDFATVVRQNRLDNDELSPDNLLQSLIMECSFKKQTVSRGIGFTANL